MQSIFEGEMVEILKSIFGKKVFLEETITTPLSDESQLGEILNWAMKEIPGVYLKSRPTHFGRDVHMEVTLSASGDDQKKVGVEIDRAIRCIEKRIHEEIPDN